MELKDLFRAVIPMANPYKVGDKVKPCPEPVGWAYPGEVTHVIDQGRVYVKWPTGYTTIQRTDEIKPNE